ncbi:hypothetical protein KIPB_005366, partial [Kipferlia bialata]
GTANNDKRRTVQFGDLQMQYCADINLKLWDMFGDTYYTEKTVERDTEYMWYEGARVFELTHTSEGAEPVVYRMQAYTQMVDADLTFDGLSTLGDKLSLPVGWSYTTRILEKEEKLGSPGGRAIIVQDELQNTYQMLE